MDYETKTIGELKEMPRNDGWEGVPTVSEAEGWDGIVEQW